MDTTGKTKPRTFRERIRRFTPSWFAAVMGTGVVSSLLRNFPYGTDSHVLNGFALAFWSLTLAMFIAFTAITIVRYIMFPYIWKLMIRHNIQSLFVACYPMALATVLNGAITLLHNDRGIGGTGFIYTIWALWWFDAALSLSVCLAMIYFMVTRHEHEMTGMTAVWILPVVPPIVASSTGQLLAIALHPISLAHSLLTITCSAVLVIVGLTLALILLTVYAQRLIVHGLPSVGLIVSVMLPVGPFGQGGYSLLLLGQALTKALPLPHHPSPILSSPQTGLIFNVICFCLALTLWAIGFWWWIFSMVGLTEVALHQRIPFRVTFWGMTFPLGVYGLLNFELGKVLNSGFFKVCGVIVASEVFLLWVFVAWRTVQQTVEGTIFHAPCLDDMPLTVGVNRVPDNDGTTPPSTRGTSTTELDVLDR